MENTKFKEEQSGKERKDYNLIFLTVKEKWHAITMLVILLMGWGPGTHIANKAELIAGVPMLWLWWVCWFVVWCLGMYRLIFKSGGKEFDD